MLTLALTLAALQADAPAPLTETHQRDIGCVATIAILAAEQRGGGWKDHDDMNMVGKRWGGIVGDRIVYETGQPRELIALAISEAVKTERARNDDIEMRKDRIADCRVVMQRELLSIDAKNLALPVPGRPPR